MYVWEFWSIRLVSLGFEQRTSELSEKAKQIEEQNIDLKKLALFPEHNPNPVVEMDFDYNLIYYNKGAKEHLKDT